MRANEAGRLIAVDWLRCAALVNMVAFHFLFDLRLLGLLPAGVTLGGWFPAWAKAIAGSFLFLAGLSLWLGHGRRLRWRAFGTRLGVLVLAAGAISVVTYLAMPGAWVRFGILHSIALCSVLGLAFLRAPWWGTLGAAGLVMFAAPALRAPAFDGAVWLWSGLGTAAPPMMDYEPLIPWLAPFLLGLAFGQAGGVRLLRGFDGSGVWARRLAWPGRHTLAIYLIHQPVLLGGAGRGGLAADVRTGPAGPVVDRIGWDHSSSRANATKRASPSRRTSRRKDFWPASRGFGDPLLEVGDGGHGDLSGLLDHVPDAQALIEGLRVLVHRGDDEALRVGIESQTLAHLPRQSGDGDAHDVALARLVGRGGGGYGPFRFLAAAQRDQQGLRFPVAEDDDADGLVDGRVADGADQLAGVGDVGAVERQDDVTRLDTRVLGRPVGHVGDERAAGPFETQRLGQLLVDVLDAHAEPAAAGLAELLQLVDDVGDDIRGHGEADADRAAGGRQDRGVHADHLTVQVEQRPARVAPVDGRIRLDVVVIGALKLAPGRGDDAGGDREALAQRVAHGHDPVAGAHGRRIAEGHEGQRQVRSSTFRSAMSVLGSVPTTTAGSSSPEKNSIRISSAFSMTWLLVTT